MNTLLFILFFLLIIAILLNYIESLKMEVRNNDRFR